MKLEYISLRPVDLGPAHTQNFRAEYTAWVSHMKKIQAWCGEQKFNWYLVELPNGRGVKFQFDWPEDLTLFLLRWA